MLNESGTPWSFGLKLMVRLGFGMTVRLVSTFERLAQSATVPDSAGLDWG